MDDDGYVCTSNPRGPRLVNQGGRQSVVMQPDPAGPMQGSGRTTVTCPGTCAGFFLSRLAPRFLHKWPDKQRGMAQDARPSDWSPDQPPAGYLGNNNKTRPPTQNKNHPRPAACPRMHNQHNWATTNTSIPGDLISCMRPLSPNLRTPGFIDNSIVLGHRS